MCAVGCVVCVEGLFSMVYILSQALETMFLIFNQGHRVDNQHPGASPQSCQFLSVFSVLVGMCVCVCGFQQAPLQCLTPADSCRKNSRHLPTPASAGVMLRYAPDHENQRHFMLFLFSRRALELPLECLAFSTAPRPTATAWGARTLH